MSKLLIVFVISVNIAVILSFPKDDHWNDEHHKAKGRKWEYSTKIVHPAPKHGYHHKGHDYHSNAYHGHGDDGKGWTHISDSGDHGHGGKHYEEPVHFEKPIHIEEPIHFEKPFHLQEPIHIEKPFELQEPIHFEKPFELQEPIHIEKPHFDKPIIPIHLPPVHTLPIDIPKYNDIGHDYQPPKHYEPQHHYEPKHHYEPQHHYEPKHYPIVKHVIHHEPKKEEHKKDGLDVNINVDQIIDDIQKDLKKTTDIKYVS